MLPRKSCSRRSQGGSSRHHQTLLSESAELVHDDARDRAKHVILRRVLHGEQCLQAVRGLADAVTGDQGGHACTQHRHLGLVDGLRQLGHALRHTAGVRHEDDQESIGGQRHQLDVRDVSTCERGVLRWSAT